jgi:hypothetical protein
MIGVGIGPADIAPVKSELEIVFRAAKIGDVAAELAKLGFTNQRGAPFSASSIKSMVG